MYREVYVMSLCTPSLHPSIPYSLPPSLPHTLTHQLVGYASKKNLSIPPCLTTVDIVWSRPLCDHCVTMAGPSLNRSISAVELYKRGVRRYTITAAASHIRGTGTLYIKILTTVTAIIWQPGH